MHIRPHAPHVIPLAQLKKGQSGRVVAVETPGILGERLMEMAGLTPGTLVSVLHSHRTGSGMRLALRGGVLSLQGGQAGAIRVEPL